VKYDARIAEMAAVSVAEWANRTHTERAVSLESAANLMQERIVDFMAIAIRDGGQVSRQCHR
jgi:delta 1-pyrroline-5-carboxylate dehydrogenase